MKNAAHPVGRLLRVGEMSDSQTQELLRQHAHGICSDCDRLVVADKEGHFKHMKDTDKH